MSLYRLLLCSFILLSLLFIGCNKAGTVVQPEPLGVSPIPENARILFASNKDTGSGRMEIYSMDAEGGSINRLTTSDKQHYIFGIDSSRRYVAATTGSEAKKQLWLLDTKTGRETPLTRAEDNAEGRSFSPDGDWIVFWMIPAGKQYSDIYKVRRDGSRMMNLTNTPQANEFDPAWSNEGGQIAFTYTDGQPNRFILKVMDADGANTKTVYDPADAVNTLLFPAGVYDPSWSPDDRYILVDKPVKFTNYGENGGAGVWHILKVGSGGATVEDLTATGELADSALYLPSFSPDGEWIVLSSRHGPEDPSQVSLDIVKMKVDGSDIQTLTSATYWAQFPVWIR